MSLGKKVTIITGAEAGNGKVTLGYLAGKGPRLAIRPYFRNSSLVDD
jgi:hypothetical protein